MKSQSPVFVGYVENGDTTYYAYLPDLEISVDAPPEVIRKSKKKLTKLTRDVKKVYPYAVLAREKLVECEAKLVGVDKRKDRKAIMKEVEKALLKRYGKELKKLTISQGKLLLKLIDRETGNASYYLVKEMRGALSAVFWQGLAKLVGSDLKSTYDPMGEDAAIEYVVQKLERGEI